MSRLDCAVFIVSKDLDLSAGYVDAVGVEDIG